MKTYDLHCVCHCFLFYIEYITVYTVINKVITKLLNFKLKIIIRHMSCTIEIRQVLPLSKIFE